MKSNEFRIGNLIHWESKNGVTPPQDIAINWSMLGNIDLQNAFCKDYTPIPITIEWLERFGFEEGKMLIDNAPKRWLQWSFATEFWIENSDKDTMHEIINVRYVHQLQNLYFALTEKELSEELTS